MIGLCLVVACRCSCRVWWGSLPFWCGSLFVRLALVCPPRRFFGIVVPRPRRVPLSVVRGWSPLLFFGIVVPHPRRVPLLVVPVVASGVVPIFPVVFVVPGVFPLFPGVVLVVPVVPWCCSRCSCCSLVLFSLFPWFLVWPWPWCIGGGLLRQLVVWLPLW
jgi:hypothetical protein